MPKHTNQTLARHIWLSILPALALAVCIVFPTMAPAQNLEPDAAPASTLSYSLQDLYNRLDSGAPGAQAAFAEPPAGPIAATMVDLNAVMGKAPVRDDAHGATADDVLAGKTFWGVRSGAGWGLITGTLSARTPDSSTVHQLAGVYEAFNLSTVDPSLASGNIRTGATIFGVTGSYAGGNGGGGDAVGIPKTGQTTSHGTRDDGALQRGVAWPTPRFTDNGNGTVTDNLTNLVWLKNANCFGAKNWTTALADANGLAHGQCGLTDGSAAGDWWLPNSRELFSLIDKSRRSPALPTGHPFTGVQSSHYWSSTSVADYTDYAWYVFMYNGLVGTYLKTSTYHVWPVRAGQ